MVAGRGLAAVAVASLLAIAGCGGAKASSSEDYAVEVVEEVLVPLDEELKALGAASREGASGEALAERLEGIEGTFAESIERLEGIRPPEGVGDAHAELTAALAAFGTTVSEVRSALDLDDPDELRRAATALGPAGVELQERITDFSQRASDAGVPFLDPGDDS